MVFAPEGFPTAENQGMMANVIFVITSVGVVVLDAGASVPQGACSRFLPLPRVSGGALFVLSTYRFPKGVVGRLRAGRRVKTAKAQQARG